MGILQSKAVYMAADWHADLTALVQLAPLGSASCQMELLLLLLHQAIGLAFSDSFVMARLLYMDVEDPWWQTPGLLNTKV